MAMASVCRAAAFTTVLSCLIVHVLPYPGGAPQSTCDDLTPRHGKIEPQDSESPYVVTPAHQRVTEGTTLRLVLSSPSDEELAGFLVQAKNPRGFGGALGTFNTPPATKSLTCGQGIRNTLTHDSNTRKKTVEIEWEPPANYEGQVVFNSTFVKDGGTFWVGVESEPVQVVKRSLGDQSGKKISTTKIPIRVTTEPNYTPPRPAQAAAKDLHPIYTGCDDVKLCFGFPDGCLSSGTCSMAVAVQMSAAPPNDYTFELLGTSNVGYISVGLSNDNQMGDDNVVICRSDNKLSMSTTNGHSGSSPLADTTGVELKDLKAEDGSIYCTYTRAASTTFQGVTYALNNNDYFLLLAAGPLNDDGSISYHTARTSSASSLTLSKAGTAGASSNLLYRLHGAFMLAAWIGFAGTGMLVARYFKKTWVGKQSCGKDIWFAWHRMFMVLTWCLTMAGFIVIFVEIGGWYGETSNPHGVLGVITTALAFVQPFAAYFRPGPSSPKRPLFNWSHWFIGNLSHLMGVITIFFARQLAKSELPEWVDFIVAAYVAFHVVMHILFSVTDCCSTRSADKKANNFQMREVGGNNRQPNLPDTKRDAPQSSLRKFLLAIYMIVVIGLTVGLVVVSALAPIEENETVKMVVQYLTSAPSP